MQISILMNIIWKMRPVFIHQTYDSKELYILLILNIFNPLIVSIRKLGQVVKYQIINATVHDGIIIFISDIGIRFS